jgi:type II secretory pathway pseudopilin PulG
MHATPQQHRRPRPDALAGFTLVELMLSIAMVVLLLIGINQVFQYTTQAISVGQTISAAVRDSRAAQTAFSQDLGSAASDGPFLIIHSSQVYAFRNRADMAADKDQDASTIDINADGKEGDTTVPGENISPATYNYRNHRVDVLSFFSRALFPAQTGDSQFVYPNVASTEARVWYGFLKLPDGSYLNPQDTGYNETTSYRFPGMTPGTSTVSTSATATISPTITSGSTASNNPNNYFATDWALGRVATLLLPTLSHTAGATNYLSSFFSYKNTYSQWNASLGTPTNLTPLCNDSAAASVTNSTTDSNGLTWNQEWSRFDVAQSSISNYSSQLQAYITANYGVGLTNGGWASNFFVGTTATSTTTSTTSQLFQCNPYVTTFSTTSTSAKTTPPAKMARVSPFLLKGCTQFIVEFAGDFVTQDNNPNDSTYGEVLNYVTTTAGNGDGLDYVLIPTYTGTVINTRSAWTKQIRWYGQPRSATGGLSVHGNKSATYNPSSYTMMGVPTFSGTLAEVSSPPSPPNSTGDSAYLSDVCPLRDLIACLPSAALINLQNQIYSNHGGWIERTLPGTSAGGGASNYADVTSSGANGLANGSDYLVAWGPDSDAIGIPRPKLIRITLTLDDSTSPNTDGQTYQYVFALPQ